MAAAATDAGAATEAPGGVAVGTVVADGGAPADIPGASNARSNGRPPICPPPQAPVGFLPFAGHTWTALKQCGSGNGRKGGTLEGWALFSGPFAENEVVAVDLKSNMRHCHAVVLAEDPDGERDSAAAPSETKLVRDVDDGRVSRVKLARLSRVLPLETPRVIIVADTTTYRRVARTQIGHGDAALEIGSCDGQCTHILTCHAAAAVGIDIDKTVIDDARRRHPGSRFEWIDLFEEPKRMAALLVELREKGTLKVFIDVGGDRAAPDVCRVIAALGEVVAALPSRAGAQAAAGVVRAVEVPLICVKSRNLAAAAGENCDCSGSVVGAEEWWPRVASATMQGSALQWKRKHCRARNAMWASHPLSITWGAWKSLRRCEQAWKEKAPRAWHPPAVLAA